PARDGLIHDDDAAIVNEIVPAHVTARNQSHPHRFEVSGRDDIDEYRNEVVLLRWLLASGRDSPAAVAAHGKVVGYACGFNAGNLRSAAHDFLPDGGTLCRIAPVVIIHADGSGAAGFKAKVDVENVQEAAQQQAGANQQHACQGDLSDHQCGTEP